VTQKRDRRAWLYRLCCWCWSRISAHLHK